MGRLAFTVFFCGLTGLSGQGGGDFLALQRRVIDVFNENKNAVVRVKGVYEQESEDGQPEIILKIGTGFFISKEGHILANATRTMGARRIWVEHLGVDYATEFLGGDSVNNIALLRLVTLPEEFGVIRMGETQELPEPGTAAIAISFYLDFDAAPSLGMVQNFARRYGNSIFPTTFLRMSISNDLGEGGSPILDLNGRLIGMMIAALPDIRSSFALPSRAVTRIRDDLLFQGEVQYSWIGMEVQSDLDPETGQVVINKVIEGTPAFEAGIRSGDFLQRVGEFPIREVEDYPNASFFTRPGQFVTVEILRGAEPLTFNLRVQDRPENEPLIVTNPRDSLPPLLPLPEDTGPEKPLPDPTPKLKREKKEPEAVGLEDSGPPVPESP